MASGHERTRVIYSCRYLKALQLTSYDAYPNLVQIWVDKGDPASTPQTADAPFIASPQIFRMNPKAGQIVRLVYTGKDLPQDRESVFYINFMQMPALKAHDMEANKLMLTVSSRMKIFIARKAFAAPRRHRQIDDLHPARQRLEPAPALKTTARLSPRLSARPTCWWAASRSTWPCRDGPALLQGAMAGQRPAPAINCA